MSKQGDLWRRQFKTSPKKILKAATLSSLNEKIDRAETNGWEVVSEIKHFTGLSTAYQVLVKFDLPHTEREEKE